MSGRIPGWLLAPLAAVVLFALPLPEWMVETFYSNGFYRYWQGWITSLSNLAPFAVLDVFILAATIGVIWRVTQLVHTAFERGVVTALAEGVQRTLRASGLLAVVFLFMWGLNYRRVPLSEIVPSAPAPTVDELRAVISDADALGARFRPRPDSDIPSFEAVTRVLREPENDALLKVHRAPLESPGRPKFSLILTPFFTWAGVSGMVNPLALETIVPPDLLPFERPMTIGHEWAHLAGTTDEAEASAIGWLACMNGGAEMAYSASMYLIVEAANALPPKVWSDVSQRLDPGIRADLDALAERRERERPEVRRTAFRVYDQYLRANRVEDGVASYDRSLVLILSPTFRDALSSYHVQRQP
jgi:hypothetical protein